MALDPGAVRHLKVAPSGEVEELDECPSCVEYERDLRRKNAQLNEMRRNKEAKARGESLWPIAVELFNYWKVRCNHPLMKWHFERYELIEPYLREYGEEKVRLAIEGAAFEAFETERKNGTIKKHDGWDLIFRNPDKFMEFVERAPRPHPLDPDPAVLVEAKEGIAALLREEADRIEDGQTPREVALVMQNTARSLHEWALIRRAAFIEREEAPVDPTEPLEGEE